MSEPVQQGQVTEWPQSLVWAVYDTLTGAAEALTQLQSAHQEWLITNENAAVIVKDASGTVTFQETEDLSGRQGAKNGIVLGALTGMLTPDTSMWSMAAKAGAWLGFGARLHDAGFEDRALRVVAESMPPNSSALIALVTHEWTDEVVHFLQQTATKVGWVVVTEQMGNAVAQAEAESGADAAAPAAAPSTLPQVQQVLVDEAVDTALNITAKMFRLPKETVTQIVQAGLPRMAQMAETNPALLKAMYAQSVKALPAPLQIYYEKIAADPSGQQQLVDEFQTLYGPMTEALNREVAGEVGVSHEQAERVLAATLPAVTRAINTVTPEASEASFSQWLGGLINQRAGVTPMSVGATQMGPQTLVWATFTGVDGASQALIGLQAAGTSDLITIQHTAVIEKDAAGKITLSTNKNMSASLGSGLLLGGLLEVLQPGASLLSASPHRAAAIGLAAQIRDAGFQIKPLQSAAETLPPDSSAIIALVTFEAADALTRFLRPSARTVGRLAISPAIRQLAAKS